MIHKKLQSNKRIVQTVRSFRNKRKVVVALSGCFDILHEGHIKFFEVAKAMGDILIVLLNGDSSVRRYKGPLRPLNSERARAAVLSGLAAVDHITLFNDSNPINIIEKIKPDIYCQGSDWGKNCVERPTVEKYGGKVVVIKKIKGVSTSNMINLILKRYIPKSK